MHIFGNLAIKARKTKLKAIVDEHNFIYDDSSVSGSSESNCGSARNVLEEVNVQIKDKAKDCRKLENERKILEFHK